MHEVQYQVGGRRWAGLRSGGDPGADPQMVALHGWMDNAASFGPLLAELGGIDVVALDLPGHGGSQHRGSWYHFVDWIGDLHQFFEYQRWSRLILVGHSLGALLASCYAALFPERLERLVLIEGLGPLTQPEEDTAGLMARAIRQRTRLLASGCLQAPRRVSLEVAVKARLAVSDLSEASARLILERNLVPDGSRWRSDPLLTAVSPLRLSEAQAGHLMSPLELPSLLIYGEKGYADVRRAIAARQHWFEHLDICQVPGGHHCHMDSPLAVATAMRQFCGFSPGRE